jgi:glycosyltransferase involved in cell wall biosynthesis
MVNALQMNVNLISFIIPAYNEEAYLDATLTAIHQAGNAVNIPYEIIVSNDASTDKTPAIAEKHGAKVVTVSHRQIAATRNSGAKAASGDLFIFVDADTLVNEVVVRAAINAIQNGFVGGGATMKFDQAPLYGRLMASACNLLFRTTKLAAGCYLYCTRQAFEKANGFDEEYFGAEEIILSRALKKQGKFKFLRETVTTSGRKMKSYSGWQVFKITASILLRGPNSVKKRRGMEFWYEGKRTK